MTTDEILDLDIVDIAIERDHHHDIWDCLDGRADLQRRLIDSRHFVWEVVA